MTQLRIMHQLTSKKHTKALKKPKHVKCYNMQNIKFDPLQSVNKGQHDCYLLVFQITE